MLLDNDSSCVVDKDENQIRFTSGTVEIASGILHLYRDKLDTTSPESTILCLPMVPIHVALSELLELMAPMLHTVTHMRVLR